MYSRTQVYGINDNVIYVWVIPYLGEGGCASFQDNKNIY
jgi:hypothetical protein